MGLGFLLAVASPVAIAQEAASAPPPAAIGEQAPGFTLNNTLGKARSLGEFRGRSVTLFFFCGCSWCAELAREWGTLQRSGAIASSSSSRKGNSSAKPPITIIVYTSGQEGLRSLAKAAGLDSRQTIYLLDDTAAISDSLYHAEPCPRVFVLDAGGKIRYVNTGPDDAPHVASGSAIAMRALSAVQSLKQSN